ncbi:MAG: 2-oxo acid dehydrogenase subunit E2 [Planctomycetes bacterium]|jgi:pyruvate dehydrogenase E2 component (dihydrolipoamide acetyltransferase)|nr:2-oxo acid dehydrogenase subunit E2 [Planctomycetota bacterium]
MAFEFKMPDIGEGLVEGEIVKWLVKAGEKIAEDQPMVEVLTDKATVELPSPRAGTVRELRAKEGDVVPVGTVIIVIDEAGGAAKPAPEPTKPAPEPAKPAAPKGPPPREPAPPAEPPREPPARVLATPAVRKYARERGVEIAAIAGTGPQGRVTREDVDRHVAAPATAPAAATTPAPHAVAPLAEDRRVPLRGLRRLISQSMARSKRTAAHFTIVEEAFVDELVRLREKLRDEVEPARLSYLPFVMKALVPALREFPYLNSSMDDASNEIVLHGGIHLGFAVDTAAGLTVPVVHDVPGKTIPELAAEIEALADRARAGRATPEDLRGGTFTITSTGPEGGLHATPVINHPEVAILGVHAIRRKPVVRGDEIAIGHVMHLSLSLDHRVVDGMTGARFLTRVVRLLEEPGRLLLGMKQ